VKARAVGIGAVAILVLNVLDFVTTRLALQRGAVEANPYMEPFVDHLPAFFAVKVLFPALVAGWLWRIRGKATAVLVTAVWLLVAFYTVVVIVNSSHLR
jgi:Domain of unknown function (DUF5658)